MLWVLSTLAVLATIALGFTWYARRPGPPLTRRGDLVTDWTRQWRRALDSLDRPVVGERPPRPTDPPNTPKRPDTPLQIVRR